MYVVQPTFLQYWDLNGIPLSSGYVYIGAANQNPETTPIQVYWDSAGTQPAAQPLRTINGVICRAGTPARVYIDKEYSITVRNKKKEIMYYCAYVNPTGDDSNNKPVSFDTYIAANGAIISPLVNTIETFGYYARGDQGGAYYVRDIAPSPGCITSADGSSFKYVPFENTVNIRCFGAKGDKVTIDTPAINLAISYASALTPIAAPDYANWSDRPKLLFPAGPAFVTDALLTIPGNIDVRMYASIVRNGAANVACPAILITDSFPIAYRGNRYSNHRFMVVRKTQSDWTDPTDIGVEVKTTYVGNDEYALIVGFQTNFKISCAYGYIKVGEIRDAQIGMLVTNAAPPDNFTNQFEVMGGSFACVGTNIGKNRYGIKLVGDNPSGVNTGRFTGQSYELGQNVAHEAMPVILDGTIKAIGNVKFETQRMEQSGQKFMRCIASVLSCTAEMLYSDWGTPENTLIDDQSTYQTNYVFKVGRVRAAPWRVIFDTGDLSKNCIKMNGGDFHVRNMEMAVNVGAAPLQQTFTPHGALLTVDAAGFMLASSGFLGTRVSLNGARSLGILGEKKATDAANVNFLLFDAAGVQITGANKVNPVEGGTLICATTAYGGFYPATVGVATDNATAFEQIFGFSADVATVFMAVSTNVRSWQIVAPDTRPKAFSSSSHQPNKLISYNIPVAFTNVTYNVGTHVEHSRPVIGSPKGWLYTTALAWTSTGNL